MWLKTIAKNIVMLVAKSGVEYLFSFLFVIYAGRELGPAYFGQLTFAFAFTALFVILSDLGLHRYLNREVAKDFNESKEKINKSLALKIVLSVITEIAVIVAINMLRYDAKTKMVVYILGLFVICQSYQTFVNSMFRGLQKTELEAWPEFFEKPLLLISGIILLNQGKGVVEIAILFLVLKALSFTFTLLLYNAKIDRISLVFPTLGYARDLLKKSAPYGVFLCFAVIYLAVDTVMLSYMKGNEAVGIYQAAMRFAVFLMIFPEAISEATLPNMVSFYYKDRKKLNDIYAFILKVLAFIGSLIAVYLLFFREWIIDVTFGAVYMTAAVLFPIIGGIVVFRFLAYGSGAMLTASNYQGIRTIIVLICAIINVLLNLLLIPRYSYVGAGIATFATNVCLSILYFIFVRIKVTKYFPVYFFIKIVSIFIITAGLNIFIPSRMFYYKLFGSGCVFLLLSWWFQILTKEELSMVKEMISGKIAKNIPPNITLGNNA